MPFDTWTPQTDNSIEIDRALEATAAALAQDRLCLFPCDTIYGLIARPSPTATRRLVDTKGRPPDKPFLLLCPLGPEGAQDAQPSKEDPSPDNGPSPLDYRYYLAGLNSFQKDVLALNWPGPITFVLPAAPALGDVHPFPTIAVRIPHPNSLVGALLVHSGPVWAPSANLSGQPYSTDITSFAQGLAPTVPEDWLGTYLRVAIPPDGQPSTIADISQAHGPADVHVLRPGAVALKLPN